MTKKPLRVAQITNLRESVPPKNKGGLEQMVHYLTEELLKLGHKVTVFGTADSQTSANLMPIWPKATSRDKHGTLMDEQTLAMWAVAEAYLHEDDFDIIHDHTLFVASHFAGVINTPVLSTHHNPISYNFWKQFPSEYQHFFEEIQEKHFRHAHPVVVSNFQAKKLHRPATVIHNGLPLTNWQNYSLETGDYLAFLGYISGNKGAAEAIRAALPTNEKLKVAGPIFKNDHASHEYFAQEIEPHLNKSNIEYIGPLEYKEKKEFLKNAKATLMPVQWDEPFGLVAIESLAVGTPVIASSRGALPEIIVNGESGFLVESVEELTTQIAEIDKIDRAACRRRYEENFTAEKMVKEYEKLYYKLINKQASVSQKRGSQVC